MECQLRALSSIFVVWFLINDPASLLKVMAWKGFVSCSKYLRMGFMVFCFWRSTWILFCCYYEAFHFCSVWYAIFSCCVCTVFSLLRIPHCTILLSKKLLSLILWYLLLIWQYCTIATMVYRFATGLITFICRSNFICAGDCLSFLWFSIALWYPIASECAV